MSALVIPAPVQTTAPSAEELEKDKLFLQDYEHGFLTRGVPSSVSDHIRATRTLLISQLRVVLLEFVQVVSARKEEAAFREEQEQKQQHRQQNWEDRHDDDYKSNRNNNGGNNNDVFSFSEDVHMVTNADGEKDNNNNNNNGGGEHVTAISTSPSFSLPRWADVRPYGSVAVGSDLVDSDVDLICLAPEHIARDDFFSEFPAFLAERFSLQRQREDAARKEKLYGRSSVSNLVAIKAAKVPVISFTVHHHHQNHYPCGHGDDDDEKNNVSSISTSNGHHHRGHEERNKRGSTGANCNGGKRRERREEAAEKEREERAKETEGEKEVDELISVFATTEVDLIFVGVALDHAPEDEDLLGIERMTQIIAPEYRLSVNGVRTALELRRLNPSTAANAFRVVATAVKSWAVLRGVAGNNFCFPGGVAWAVLVVRILQMYPSDCCAGLFRRFFLFWSIWLSKVGDVVSTNNNNNNISSSGGNNAAKAVKLTVSLNAFPHVGRVAGMPETWAPAAIDYNNSGSSGNIFFASFDLFPVLNPAFPHLNTTHSMSLSTVSALAREFDRAFEIIKKASTTTTTAPAQQQQEVSSASIRRQWRLLLTTPYVIWSEYKTFIIIEAACLNSISTNSNNNNNGNSRNVESSSSSSSSPFRSSLEWTRFVESRLKVLVYALDSSGLVECRPVCESFRGDDLDKNKIPVRPVPPSWIAKQRQQQEKQQQVAGAHQKPTATTTTATTTVTPSTAVATSTNSRYIPPKPTTPALPASASASAERNNQVSNQQQQQQHVDADCRTFFVVGVRPISSSQQKQQQQQQQVSSSESAAAESSEIARMAAALKPAIDEFLFSVSSDAQYTYATASAAASSTAFRHTELMLHPEISVVLLRNEGENVEKQQKQREFAITDHQQPPRVNMEESKMNSFHSEELVRELLRRSVPAVQVAQQSSPRRNRE